MRGFLNNEYRHRVSIGDSCIDGGRERMRMPCRSFGQELPQKWDTLPARKRGRQPPEVVMSPLTLEPAACRLCFRQNTHFPRRAPMGRGILLWLLRVPIPIILLLALFWH